MHGGLLEGLRYMSDYILITEKMHSYFSMWYGFQIGPILKRQKILLNDKTVLGIDNDDSEDDLEDITIAGPFMMMNLEEDLIGQVVKKRP
jgi:hypothetical protein